MSKSRAKKTRDRVPSKPPHNRAVDRAFGISAPKVRTLLRSLAGVSLLAIAFALGLYAFRSLNRPTPSGPSAGGEPPTLAGNVAQETGAENLTTTLSASPTQSSPGANQPTPSLDELSARASTATGEVPRVDAKQLREMDNPAQDGWDSEVFSDQANLILNQLGKWITDGKQPIAVDRLQAIADPQVVCSRLLPEQQEVVFSDQQFRVVRGTELRLLQDDASKLLPLGESVPRDHSGIAGLQTALLEMMQPWQGAEDLHYKFKMFRTQLLDNQQAATRQYLALSGKTPTGWREMHATWRIDWNRPAASDPQLASLQLEAYEQSELLAERPRLFADCTTSILGGNPCYRQQFLVGMNEWLERLQETRYFSTLGTPGIAVADVNGDGLDDLFVCQEAGLPNRLFLQKPDGTAEDVSQAWGVDWIDSSRSALLVDLDNDGDQDLAVATLGGVVLAENERQQRFLVRRVVPTEDDTMSLVASDFDHDADVDLYVCVDYPNDLFSDTRDISTLGGATNRVYHDANGAGRNSLLRNDIRDSSDWRFTDVTVDTGIDVNNRRFSLAAAWADYDNDGDQDLYVANDFGRNNLYRNRLRETGKVQFEDVAGPAGAEDSASGMSADWGDINRDGWLDLYVGNMFSAAGGRITFQPKFQAGSSEEAKSRLQRFARGSTLLKNNPTGVFEDVSEQAGVTVGRWAWSSNLVDFNNDGWQDILVANGYITADDTGDL